VALQAPVVAVGCSVEHLAFAGTLSWSAETLVAVVGDTVASLVAHGFDHVVVFSAHGGNDAALAGAVDAIAARAGGAAVTVVHGIDAIAGVWAAASGACGVDVGASGAHAGEFETSIIAALRPESIRADRVARGVDGDVPDPQRLFYPSLRDHAPDGVVGDPRAASAERAEGYLAAWTAHLVAAWQATEARRT
jgi:creatinine amidohydrolase